MYIYVYILEVADLLSYKQN